LPSAFLQGWLLQLAKDAAKKSDAGDLSKYFRGLILKHAQSLGLPIPKGTEEDWPEWAKKKIVQHEIEPF